MYTQFKVSRYLAPADLTTAYNAMVYIRETLASKGYTIDAISSPDVSNGKNTDPTTIAGLLNVVETDLQTINSGIDWTCFPFSAFSWSRRVNDKYNQVLRWQETLDDLYNTGVGYTPKRALLTGSDNANITNSDGDNIIVETGTTRVNLLDASKIYAKSTTYASKTYVDSYDYPRIILKNTATAQMAGLTTPSVAISVAPGHDYTLMLNVKYTDGAGHNGFAFVGESSGTTTGTRVPLGGTSAIGSDGADIYYTFTAPASGKIYLNNIYMGTSAALTAIVSMTISKMMILEGTWTSDNNPGYVPKN